MLGNIVEDQPPVDCEWVTWVTGVTVEWLVEGIGANEMVAVEFRKDVRFEYADLTISAEYQQNGMEHVLLPECEEIRVELREANRVETLAAEILDRKLPSGCSRRS